MESRSGSGTHWCGAALLLAALLLGCEQDRWQGDNSLRAPDEDVAAALGDTSHQQGAGVSPQDVPVIQYPRALRPCCVFGKDLEVKLDAVRVPGIEIGNILGPGDVGHHRYDNGFLSIAANDPRGFIDDENNGLVATCRGGFVDTAHVRDNADNTLALSDAVARMMDSGGTIEVPPQGASMRVQLRAIPAETIERHGRMRLAVALAQWLAYQLSIWHEVATWFGYASLAEWPEKISAFSPEDLYSNQLGARIAGAIVLSGGARSDEDYALNMDAWIAQTLKRLHVVSLSDARSAAGELDGIWWDSARRIPDWMLVQRRRMDTGPQLYPWTLELASPARNGPVAPLAACKGAGPPLVLHVADGWNGVAFRELATVEFEVGDGIAAQGFPFPSAGSRLVTQDDFPAVIDAIRRANAETFGEVGDRP